MDKTQTPTKPATPDSLSAHMEAAKKRYQERLGRFDPEKAAKTNACQICNGAGWVRFNYPVDHPLFGRLSPCTCNNQVSGRVEDEHGLLPSERNMDWQLLISMQEIGAKVNEAQRVIKAAIERGYGWVYLWGGYGTAKTTLLKIGTVAALKAGVEGCYVRMVDMMDEIRLAYDAAKPMEDAARRVRYWSNLPFLALDELEKVSETASVNERRFQILDSRYNQAINGYGVTLIAGNVSPNELAARTETAAIADRLKDGRFAVIELTGKSFRAYSHLEYLDK